MESSSSHTHDLLGINFDDSTSTGIGIDETIRRAVEDAENEETSQENLNDPSVVSSVSGLPEDL
jgi:hypothetical protein